MVQTSSVSLEKAHGSRLRQSEYPKVAICILYWKGLADTLECLESVREMAYPNLDVVLVDNGCEDGSTSEILRRNPEVQCIRSCRNIGYTGGNNLAMHFGISHGADYLWLLNSDVVVESDCLAKLLSEAECADDVGLVSPVICNYYNRKRWQFAGSRIDLRTLRIRGLAPSDSCYAEYQRGPDICLWGTALIVKRSLVERIGYLDDSLFAYHEDIDYSLRALQAGFTNVVCAQARVYHKGGAGDRRRPAYWYYYQTRNWFLFVNKHSTNWLLRVWRTAAAVLLFANTIRDWGEEGISAGLLGIWHGLRGVSGQMKESRPMPKPYQACLRILSKLHPYVLHELVLADFSGAVRTIWRKIKVA